MLHTVKLVGNSDLGIERRKKEGFDENLESEKKKIQFPHNLKDMTIMLRSFQNAKYKSKASP